MDDLGFQLPPPPHVSKKRVAIYGAIAVAVLAALFVGGLLPKLQRDALAHADARERIAPPRVSTVKPKRAPGKSTLDLPANVQAVQETTVYSRANGYVRRWLVDIGDRVQAGQLMAEIDTPELDQELQQNRAMLGQRDAAVAQAKASLDLSNTMLERYKQLAPSGFASQQDLEQRQSQARVDEANLLAAQAAVAAQRANVNRLLELKSFARVMAPFSGLVTVRNIDRGALVSATTRLYTLAATDPVRVFIQVPQSLAGGIEQGLRAKVSVRELPARAFEGEVTRTSGALDPSSRTLTVEIRVPNKEGALLVGMYAQVSLTLASSGNALRVPAAAILARSEGLRVAVVGPDSRIKLLPVTVSRDDGADVEISAGLNGDEDVVANPGARIEEGLLVAVARS